MTAPPGSATTSSYRMSYDEHSPSNVLHSPTSRPVETIKHPEEGHHDVEYFPNEFLSHQIQSAIDSQDLQLLDEIVAHGAQILERIKMSFTGRLTESMQSSQRWISHIKLVIEQAQSTETIIGVVGSTGAGKSSIINAILDVERLVPTSCMRACTSVITEISNNSQSDQFRAQIEYISREDWRSELQVLLDDLEVEPGKISRDVRNDDSAAYTAYAKIKAVYPTLSRETILNFTADDLMAHENVQCLGSKHSIVSQDATQFYRELQSIIDSKEKLGMSGKRSERKKLGAKPALWPLIKVVRLYVNSPVLSTGAIIVDLPGVQDSNPARAKIAETYIRKCTSLWIVAPINRAVDDKVAKSLLGESFRRQLKMDGTLDAITFICSKTDEISVLEAQESLDLETEFAELDSQLEELQDEHQDIEETIKLLKVETARYGQCTIDLEDQVNKLPSELLSSRKAGSSWLVPPTNEGPTRKRKHDEGWPKKYCRERDHSSDSDDSDMTQSTFKQLFLGAGSSSSRGMIDKSGPVQLLIDDFGSKIGQSPETRKDILDHEVENKRNITNYQRRLQEIRTQISNITECKRQRCIVGRNEYSKAAIQQDFAAGLRELDEENIEEADVADLPSERITKDYGELCKRLPVFCVSSRAFQKMSGRLPMEADALGFSALQHTEMPQLQDHCRQMTLKARLHRCSCFGAGLSQILNSLKLWCIKDQSEGSINSSQWSDERQVLGGNLERLQNDFELRLADYAKDFKVRVSEHLLKSFDKAVDVAIADATSVVSRWHQPALKGGYHWMTYKAICTRNGEFRNAKGPHSFNGDLVAPMNKVLAPAWSHVFSHLLDAITTLATVQVHKSLEKFHSEAALRARTTGIGIQNLTLLAEQQKVYKSLIEQHMNSNKVEVMSEQREISRAFGPEISKHMASTYADCRNETGGGSLSRAQENMENSVDLLRTGMFRSTRDMVKANLDRLIERMKCQTGMKLGELLLTISSDYMNALGGEAESQDEDELRVELGEIIACGEEEIQEVISQHSTTSRGYYRAVSESDSGTGFGERAADDGPSARQRPNADIKMEDSDQNPS